MSKKLKITVNGNKPFWKSKTLWINALLLVAALMSAIAGELQTGALLTLTSLMNLALRVITQTKLDW